MRKFAFLFSMVLFSSTLMAQGYGVGDTATDFRLLNVDGNYVSMADFPDAKGFVVIFSCNHCPYVVAYEDRMIELHNTYAPKGFPIIAVNPNDTIAQPADSYTKMIERAQEKNFPFPYLFDDGQKVYPQYGATRTPHVYLLERVGSDLKVAYIGAIDDNYRDADQVTEPFLANAIDALLKGERPHPPFTRAIGCTIKTQ
jgi:peroxiredoxin